MDGNLLAGIFDAREKVEEWRKTPLPDTEPSIALTPEGDAPSSSSPSSTPTAPATSAPVSKVAMDHNMGDLYTVAVCGVVKKTDGQHMLSKSSHVEFGITVTRLCDGASRTVYRRFREIKQFYYDLIGTFSEIEFNKHIKFPMYDSWLSSSSSDPHSELVVRRKVDLQAFFSELFQQYPKLFDVSRVTSFLEIDSFPPRAISSFTIHNVAVVGANTMTSDMTDNDILRLEHLDASDVVYDSKKGKLIRQVAQEDWVSFANAVDPMSLVEFLSFAEAEEKRKAKEKKKAEASINAGLNQ